MDDYRAYALDQGIALADHPEQQSFLFLQGPISTFFDRLGRALIARGHQVHRINLHLGDQLFWRLPATHYRGHFGDWREFVRDFLERHRITHLVLHGDRRPYHLVAAEEARARGIRVISTDLGYVRPDWLTLEYDGMTTYSRFPRDPAAIRALAAQFPEPELAPRFSTPFWLIAALDILYNLGLVFGHPLYPGYRYHSIVHPFAEYAGWIWSRPRKWLRAQGTATTKQQLQAAPGSYFLVPLQLATDYQIRAHSPYSDEREAVREILRSFAASGSRKQLVFVVHPLDNGLIDWHALVRRLAEKQGVADRVFALHGGTPTDLLRNAAGIVTINSTVGATAVCLGVPVKALGNAIFDVPGLTCQAPLDAFWQAPPRPDPVLIADFLRALIGTTQVKGGYYEPASQACAIAGFIARFEQGLYPLPPLAEADYVGRVPRSASRTVVVTEVSGEVGLALARAYATPGIRLCLIGRNPATLAQAAADCRHRGALVETHRVGPTSHIAECIAAAVRGSAIDLLIVNDGPSGRQRDVVAAMEAVRAAIASLQPAGGSILLVSAAAGRAANKAEAALSRSRALQAYAASLRRRHGIGVAVVAPATIALHAAAWLREPRLAAMAADRLADLLVAARPHAKGRIAVPPTTTVGWRALRVAPTHMREWLRERLSPSVEKLADDVPLPEETGSGD